MLIKEVGNNERERERNGKVEDKASIVSSNHQREMRRGRLQV